MDQKRRAATGGLQADNNGEAAGPHTRRPNELLKRLNGLFPAWSSSVAARGTQKGRAKT
jgi:hypothetical protein